MGNLAHARRAGRDVHKDPRQTGIVAGSQKRLSGLVSACLRTHLHGDRTGWKFAVTPVFLVRKVVEVLFRLIITLVVDELPPG